MEAAGRLEAGGRWDPVLAVCLALAAGLRLWGITYGLPYVYNPDEVAIMSRALSLANHGLNPHNFVYPTFFFYVLAGAVGVLYAGMFLTRGTSAAAFEAQFWNDPSAVYLAGRLVSVVAGVLTVAVVYALGRRLGGRTTARAAAALMAVAYFPVRDAHMVKHDVPVTLVIAVLALACWRVWQRGRARDYAAAGLLAGAGFAVHYYAFVAAVPVAAAHALRVARGEPALDDRRPWLAALGFAVAFACLSPYVLLDWNVALRDIVANRQIVVDRGLATFGVFGAAREHLRLLITQGAGAAFVAAAAGGSVWLAVERPAAAVWLFSFPLAFFVFISNIWPFGRTENALFPFLAVAAGFAISRAASLTRAATPAAVALTALCAAQPLWHAVIFDRLMTRTDTRTLARQWLDANVPDGAGVAVQPNSVWLVPTRERLREALERNVGSVERAGYKFRQLLAREPYPSPAYRLSYLGVGGLDEDKIYYDPADLARPGILEALARDGLEIVVLKRVGADADPLRDRLAAVGQLVHRVSPFREDAATGEPQLPDQDVRPALDVARPGPIVEIWRVR
jgi:4-amino-4-deoxy-L-arabinose transferase-like glycosyltransferase